MAVEVRDNFNISTLTTTVQGINHKYCKTVQKGDGSMCMQWQRPNSNQLCSLNSLRACGRDFLGDK